MKTKSFKDKVAIITGSSRGIGKSTAIALSNQGANVVLNGRNKKNLSRVENIIKNNGGKVISFCGDICNPDHAKKLVDRAKETFGRIDILINNAGMSMRGHFGELNPVVFKSIFDINVLGTVNTSIYALPHIKETNGSIVFVSSVAGIRGLPNNSAYSSSKMALRAIAESIRIEEFNSNIHVGLIYVGITEIEKDKKTIAADGSLLALEDRSKFKVQSRAQVANSILTNIRNRKFRTILTGMGKLNAFLQPIAPDLVEKILIRSNKIIQSRSI